MREMTTTVTFIGGPLDGERLAVRRLDRYFKVVAWDRDDDLRIYRDRDGICVRATPGYRTVIYELHEHAYRGWCYVYEEQILREAPPPPVTMHHTATDATAQRYCEPCDVFWTGGKHCWSCGEERLVTRERPSITSQGSPGAPEAGLPF